MRNLKRALSLALASVMLLGMMVVGSSAAGYDDVDQEDNVEAIAVLQAVKVMNGYDDGLFHPEANVTRNQMAKIICALKGVNENDFATVRPYTDVPEWAANAVGACTAYKIVNGRGNGIYDGDANVTAIEAAAMLLRTLGYTELPLGDGWDRYVAEYASRIRLFEDISIGSNEYMNRNQIAQLTLNALQSAIVDPEQTTTITTPDGITVSTGNVNYVVVASDKPFAKAINDTEVSTSGSGTGLNGVSGYVVELGEQLYNGELKLNGDDVDDFGRPSRTWNYKNDKIGTYVKRSEISATYTGKVSKGDIYGLLSSTVRSDLEKGNAKFAVYVDGVRGNADLVAADTNPTGYWERNSSTAIYTMDGSNSGDNSDHGSSRKGTLTEVFVDSDNNTTITITNTYVFQATADYSASNDEIRVTPVGDTSKQMALAELTLSGEDFNVSHIKADDYLLITAAKNASGLYDAKSVTVAEKVQGVVDSYDTNDSVTIDGTKYSYSAICWNQNGQASDKGTTYTVGQEAIVVLDAYGNIITVDEARASSSFVFVNAFGTSNSSLDSDAMASLYFTDGTKANVTVKQLVEADGTTIKTATGMIAHGIGWFNFSKDSDGKYTLYAPSTTKYVGGNRSDITTGTAAGVNYQLMESGTVRFLKDWNDVDAMTTVSAALANERTIVIVRDKDGDVAAYNGTGAIPDVTVKYASTPAADDMVRVYYLKTDKDYVEFAFVDLYGTTGTVVGGDEDASFLFLLKRNGQSTEGNSRTYFRYDAVNEAGNGAEEKRFANDTYANTTTKVKNIGMLYYKARYNSDDEINSMTLVPDNDGTRYFNHVVGTEATTDLNGNPVAATSTGVVTWSNNTLRICDDAFRTNSDSKIVVINTVRGIGNWEGDNWKITRTDGNGLAGMLAGWSITKGSIGGATVSTTDKTIDELYVYIGAAAKTSTDPSNPNPGGTPSESGKPSAVVPGTAAPGSNSTPLTINYFEDMDDAKLKKYVEEQVAASTGYSVETYNTLSKELKTSDGSTFTITTQRIYSLTIGNSKVWGKATATVNEVTFKSTPAAGQAKAGAYIDQATGKKVDSSGVVKADGDTLQLTADTVLLPAIQVGVDSSVTVKVKGTDDAVANNNYVVKDTELTVTGTKNTNGTLAALSDDNGLTAIDGTANEIEGGAANTYTYKVEATGKTLKEVEVVKVMLPGKTAAVEAVDEQELAFTSPAKHFFVKSDSDTVQSSTDAYNGTTAAQGKVSKGTGDDDRIYKVKSSDAQSGTVTVIAGAKLSINSTDVTIKLADGTSVTKDNIVAVGQTVTVEADSETANEMIFATISGTATTEGIKDAVIGTASVKASGKWEVKDTDDNPEFKTVDILPAGTSGTGTASSTQVVMTLSATPIEGAVYKLLDSDNNDDEVATNPTIDSSAKTLTFSVTGLQAGTPKYKVSCTINGQTAKTGEITVTVS